MSAEQITHEETISSGSLWFGVLAAPVVWAGQLLLDFGLTEAVVCAPGSRTQGQFFGVGIHAVIQITNAVAAAIALLALMLSVRCYRRTAGIETTGNRARWMALAGIFNSSLFLIVIATKFASTFFLSACGSSL
jgi:hypothetical protein